MYILCFHTSFRLFFISSYVPVKFWPPYPPPFILNPTPGYHVFNKLECTLYDDSFPQVTAFLYNMNLKRRFLKYYNYIFLCKNSTSHCSPILQLGNIIWTNLNLRCLKMLLYKLHLFWSIGFCGEDFYFIFLVCKN